MNIAVAIFGLMNGITLMIGIGGVCHYTFLKSQQRHHEANEFFTLSFTMALGVGICFFLTGYFGASWVARCLGAHQDILFLCTTYLKTVLMFAPCFLLNHLLMTFIRNDGAPQLSMLMMVIGSLSNIILDYLFMYLLHMGIFGAALATGLAPTISILIGAFYILLRKNGFHCVMITPKFLQIKRMMEPGISSFINEFSSSLVLIVYNSLIFHLAGNIGVAAYGIIANLALIVVAIFNGISQGIQPLFSQAYGRNKDEDIQYLYQKGCFLVVMMGLCILTIAYFCSYQLVSLFNHDNHSMLQLLAHEGMKSYFIGFLFIGYNYLMIVLLSTMNQASLAFRLSFFRGCLGIIIVVCLFTWLWGLQGLWLAFPFIELLTMLMVLFQYRKIKV